MKNINQGLYSQKNTHISPSRVSYQVSIVSILEKTDRIITAPHCTHHVAFNKEQYHKEFSWL